MLVFEVEDNPHVASSSALRLCPYGVDLIWRTGLTFPGDFTPRDPGGNSSNCLPCGARSEDSSGTVVRALQRRNFPA